MEIEIDLKFIERMGKEREDENWEFRTFLKQIDTGSKKLDALVHQLTAEVSSQIDCTECANCCRQIRPVLDKDDISEFAMGLRMTVPNFEAKYLSLHEDKRSKHVFNALPCPFLKENRCSNYGCRPNDCVSYPHLYKDGFSSRLIGVIANYSICPIVFNVYEQLKARLWHYNELDEDTSYDYT